MQFILGGLEATIDDLEVALDDDMSIGQAQDIVAEYVLTLRSELQTLDSNLTHPE